MYEITDKRHGRRDTGNRGAVSRNMRNRVWPLLAMSAVVFVPLLGYVSTAFSNDGMSPAIMRTPLSFDPALHASGNAAVPGQGIDLIAPPVPSSMGDAELSYPLDVPSGRSSLQPHLQIGYSSAQSNGWLGLGWNLTLPEIAVDTRWGVPRYTASTETESYLMDGQQLTPGAHRGTPPSRQADKVFRTRLEGDFSRIVRHGDRPSNYWWEVTDQNGTRYLYGDEPGKPTGQHTLRDDAGNIFKWALRTVRDIHDNSMNYSYVPVTDPGTPGSVLPGVNLYPKTITYTGYGSTAGPYEVVFVRDRELSGFARRRDVIVDARGGFKQVTADLLRRVEVYFDKKRTRAYELTYVEGDYSKTLLSAITQQGEDGSIFHTHSFAYYRDAPGFAAPTSWSPGDDDVATPLFKLSIPELGLHGKATALSGSISTSLGGHLYLGFNPASPSKANSVGGKLGYTHDDNESVLELVDLNGDSLPDKVFKANGQFWMRLNRSGPSGGTSFGPALALPTLPALGEEESHTISVGAEAYPGPASIMLNHAETFSTGKVYFSDVNGDQLPDLVSKGSVLFNHLGANGVPTFTASSSDTPVPIATGSAIDASAVVGNYEDSYQQQIDASPLHDTLRRWVSPYDGTLRISGSVKLAQPSPDGVRVAIQLNQRELWSASLDSTTAKTPSGVEAVQVHVGDRIYFRVQSVLDGVNDEVVWDPELRYSGAGTRKDANGLDPFVFQASADFVLAGHRDTRVVMPLAGTVRLSGSLQKTGITTDDVTVVIRKNGTPIAEKTLAWNKLGDVTIDQDIVVAKQDALQFYVRIDSPIDMRHIKWMPKVEYRSTTEKAPNGTPIPVRDVQGKALVELTAPFFADLYPWQSPHTAPSAWVAPKTGRLTVSPRLTARLGTSGTVSFTVKKQGALLGKQQLTISNGVISGGALTIEVTQGDALYIDYAAVDPELAATLSQPDAHASYSGDGQPVTIAGILHGETKAELFAPAYRSWSYVGYNGNRELAQKPIDEARLVLDTKGSMDKCDASKVSKAEDISADCKPDSAKAYMFRPDPGKQAWAGPNERISIKSGSMSSSRLGAPSLGVPRPAQFAGARAVHRISRSSMTSISGGVGPVSGSYGTGKSYSELDYLDMNGDGLPDVVGNGRVQYTTPQGGLEARSVAIAGLDRVRESSEESWSAGLAGNPVSSKGNSKGTVNGGAGGPTGNKSGAQMAQLGLSGSLGGGKSDGRSDFLDMNGDGLPDRVVRSGDQLMVALNLGYRFAASESWGKAAVNDSTSRELSLGLSPSFNSGNYDFAGGLSASKNSSQQGCAELDLLGTSCAKPGYLLIDLNGDGLPDRLTLQSGELRVAFNNGTGFVAETTWSGLMEKAVLKNGTTSVGGGVYFTIGIGPLCLAGCYLIVNPGFDGGQSMGRQELALIDVDGDGDLDHVASMGDEQLTVAKNRTERGNLLQAVNRPLGATLTLEYQRDGNTTDSPSSRWVLSKVTTFDGHRGDGVDDLVTTYRYEDGRHDRLEREFYGYRRVVEEDRDASKSNALYRSVIREYQNDSFYTHGLLHRERVQDASGRAFTETEHTYALRDVDTNSTLTNPRSTTATVFPQRIRTDVRHYESQPAPGQQTSITYEYDQRGMVIRTVDAGDSGADDDRVTSVAYSQCPSTNLYAVPVKTVVADGRGTVLQHSEAQVDCAKGVVVQSSEVLDSQNVAITEYTYDRYGNIVTVTEPANAAKQRYSRSFKYDSATQTYVVETQDSFGLTATATYNLAHGVIESVTDQNRQRASYNYDTFGRLVEIIGPYEQGSSTPTVRYEYHPEAAVPWARTKQLHKLAGAKATIDTVVFSDGLGRSIQDKGSATVHAGNNTRPQDVMVVSGKMTFDQVGRAVELFAPTTEPLGNESRFYAGNDARTPARMAYDVLDRLTSVTRPDLAQTVHAFAFAADRDGVTRRETTITDANGKKRFEYRDVRSRITAIKELNQGGQQVIWTGYGYDALDRLTRVRDHKNNLTQVAYDRLGRRTTLDNPDTGRITYGYDLASNRISEADATMAVGTSIRYRHDHHRLIEILYPKSTADNVTYAYGAAGAPGNQAGRITKVKDRSGTEEFYYGKLGETIKQVRTFTAVVQAQSAKAPPVYTTEYSYDSFGRLATLTYPDSEVLTYEYDSGGQIRKVSGGKARNHYSYVEQLDYDKYGKPVFMEMGNKVQTSYAYDPDNLRLTNQRVGDFMNLSYGYDRADNLLSLKNDVPLPKASESGGPNQQAFAYDDLYRLTSASGTWQMAARKSRRYQLGMTYDELHNIVKKTQADDIVQSQSALPQRDTTYAWSYSYAGSQPHAATKIGDRSYSYDASGNMLTWTHDQNGTRSKLEWDDAGRIESIFLNGHKHAYTYDHAGTRAIKRGPQGETVYVNRYFTIRNSQDGTKYIFVNGDRLVSKKMGQPGPGDAARDKAPAEKELYFYHTDHLGGTAYVTDDGGKLYQHMEYLPFGETWAEEASNAQRTPYRYTGKELDEETGLYYFGARYYDPQTSMWPSTDPALGEYIAGTGIYQNMNIAMYTYAALNPLRYIDPDGRMNKEGTSRNGPPSLLNGVPGKMGKAMKKQGGEFMKGLVDDIPGVKYGRKIAGPSIRQVNDNRNQRRKVAPAPQDDGGNVDPHVDSRAGKNARDRRQQFKDHGRQKNFDANF
jgi:RHS repeat-associated protein